MPPPLGTSYTQFITKTANYTLTVNDDVAIFTTSAPGVIATLPLARTCAFVAGQNTKQIINASGSTNVLTVAVQSGDTLVGETASGPAQTLAAGESAIVNCSPNLPTIWTITGGDGSQGVSGYSGFSGASGYSGKSGYSGFSGKSGYSGYTGVSGFSGYTGVSGTSGYSGFSGISGYSGYSGTSGYSGFSAA
jgi:hypothetical protein